MSRQRILAVAALLTLGSLGCSSGGEVVTGAESGSGQDNEIENEARGVSDDEEASHEQGGFAGVSADQLRVTAAWLPDGYEYHSEMRQDHGSENGIVIQRYVGPTLSDAFIDDLPPGPIAKGAQEQLHVALTNVPPGEATWSFEYGPAGEVGAAREVTVADSEAWIMELGNTVGNTRLEFLVEPGLLVQVTSFHLGDDQLLDIAEGISVEHASEEPGS